MPDDRDKSQSPGPQKSPQAMGEREGGREEQRSWGRKSAPELERLERDEEMAPETEVGNDDELDQDQIITQRNPRLGDQDAEL